LELNFKEALAALARAFPAYLFYAAALVLGGLLVLLEFVLALFVLRLTRITASSAVLVATAVILLGGWLTLLAWRRFFIYRRQAAMFFLFSGTAPLQAAGQARHLFPAYSNWAGLNRRLKKALSALQRSDELSAVPAPTRGIVGRLARSTFSPAILSLAFARGAEPEVAIREGLALYWRHGGRARGQERRWLGFSVMGLALLFLCLALPNWFFFKSAGAPVVIGIVLAAVIAWFLHQAFVAPLALAGVSAMLLAETRGREPDPDLCEKLASMLAF
jgi:hypothetical protein